MMFATHLITGLLASLIISDLLHPSHKILFIAVVCLASVIPDIDYSKSKVGKKAGILSHLLQMGFGHRGLLHTVYVPIALFAVFIGFNLPTIAFAVLFGYLLHIIIDALTPEGVRMFAPLFNFHIRGFIRTGSWVEAVFFIAVAFSAIVFWGLPLISSL